MCGSDAAYDRQAESTAPFGMTDGAIKRSNTRSRLAGGIPGPSSVTHSSTSRSLSATLTSTRPPGACSAVYCRAGCRPGSASCRRCRTRTTVRCPRRSRRCRDQSAWRKLGRSAHRHRRAPVPGDQRAPDVPRSFCLPIGNCRTKQCRAFWACSGHLLDATGTGFVAVLIDDRKSTSLSLPDVRSAIDVDSVLSPAHLDRAESDLA